MLSFLYTGYHLLISHCCIFVSGPTDLLTDDLEQDDADKDDMTLLNEILNAPSTGEDEFTQEWQAVFGLSQQPSSPTRAPAEMDQAKTMADFMPSNLLDLSSQMSAMSVGQGENLQTALTIWSAMR